MRRRRRLFAGLAAGGMLCLLGAGALAPGGLAQEGQAAQTQTGEPRTGPTLEKTAPEATEPATAASVAYERFSPGQLLVTLPWGAGAGEVGLTRPQEGLAHGPEALAVAPDGRIAVLDSVNKRVVCLNPGGAFLRDIPVPLAEPRFLAVDSERLYVLDCDNDRALAVLDWEGQALNMLVLPDLPDVVTGLFATAQGPSVEVAHESTYLLTGDRAALATAEGTLRTLAGRPLDFGPGRAAKVTFNPKTGAEVRSFALDPVKLTATRETSRRPLLASGRALEHLVSVDSDGRGGLIIGARLLQAGSPSDGKAALALTRMPDPALEETVADKVQGVTQVLLLAEKSLVYVGQPYVVAPDGRIFQPVAETCGYSILVHEFTAAGSESTEPSPQEVKQ